MFCNAEHRLLHSKGGQAMTCCVFAVGKQGLRACHALLDAAMTGVLEKQDLHLILIGAEEQQAETLQNLVQDYQNVRVRLMQSGLPWFQCGVTADIIPEEGLDASLQERCETDEDRLLMNCLFLKERMLRRSAASSLETAQAAWADFLENDGDRAVRESTGVLNSGDLILVTGSLCETIAAGGYVQLISKIREYSKAPVGTVLSLPIHRSDRTDLVQSVLRDMPAVDASYIYGLPEDLRTEGDGMDELVAIRCMDHFMRGGRGAYTYAQAMDVPDWSFFGSRETEYRERITAVLHLSAMMLLRYGPEALERLERNGAGIQRGWFGKVYGQIRRDPERMSQERLYLRSVMHLLRFHMAWCYLVTGSLPLPLRYQAQLQETEKKASDHYDAVLNAAGRLALFSHDVKQSGILEEETIHRESMEDTEGEAARKKVVEMAEKVKELAAEQAQLEEILGGRAAFMLLEAKKDAAEQEANHLREQAEEASRRIEEAAREASAEDLPKIDAARSRLANLYRHLVLLEGRVDYARRDVERARAESERNRKPKVEYTEDNEPDVLFNRRLLKQMITVYDQQSGERGREHDHLIASVTDIDLQHLQDVFDRQGQEMDGTADMLSALYMLWVQEYTGR